MLAATTFYRHPGHFGVGETARPAAEAIVVAAPWIVPVDYVPSEGPQDESPEVMRILVVAGDPLARTGLAALVAAMPDCRVVGAVPDDTELPDAIERLDPDAVVWDLGPTVAAPDQRALGDTAPPVLVLVPRGFTGFKAAPTTAGGVLPRDTDVPTLAVALRAVARGLTVFDPAFTSPAGPSRDRAAVELPEALTPREVEVLQWLAAGLSNKLIAERLGISEHTVRFHLNAIFGKLDAHTRTEAVSRAVQLGLIVL
jgi:two-component system, NarL family, nitrate/nitrite response regulator NarL